MEGCKENTARKKRRKQVKKSQSPEKTIKFRVGRKQKAESRNYEQIYETTSMN